PVQGEYVFRTIMRGTRPVGSDPLTVAFWIDGKIMHQATVSFPKSGEVNGQWAEFRTTVTAGEHWLAVTLLKMFEGLPPAYKGPNPSNSKAGITKGSDGYFPMYLDVVGPYKQVTGPSEESLCKIFGNGPRDPARVREILADLARRAYRRPVTAKEVDDLVKTVAMVQADGESFEEGLCLAIQRLLISPHFLFRVEKGQGQGIHPVSQHELAARLSYFL